MVFRKCLYVSIILTNEPISIKFSPNIYFWSIYGCKKFLWNMFKMNSLFCKKWLQWVFKFTWIIGFGGLFDLVYNSFPRNSPLLRSGQNHIYLRKNLLSYCGNRYVTFLGQLLNTATIQRLNAQIYSSFL